MAALAAGSNSGVELFHVCMCTGLWQDGADEQVFHCLSILAESPFLHQGFSSSSPCADVI